MRMTLALLVVATALAGCSGGDSEAGGTDGTITDATGKQVVDDAPANQTTTTDSGKKVAVNKGLVFGRVHDDFNFSLEGAFVTIVGTAHFTETNATGQYLLGNVTVGTFDVRVEMDGFKVGLERVSIEKGQELRLDFELLPLQPRSGGFNPHVHDFWGDAETRVLMDHDLSINEGVQEGDGPAKGFYPAPLAATECGVSNCRFSFTLPEQEDGRPATVWPGTKEMRVTFGWSGTTMLISGIQLQYSDPLGNSDPVVSEQVVANGGTVVIPVAPEQQDHGHAGWTAWRFTAVTKNSATAPGFVRGTLHVSVEIVKGDVVLDPPHRDFWQGQTQMPIGNWERTYLPNVGAVPTPADSTDGLHVLGIHTCTDEQAEAGCISIVPPGTGRLEVRFAWLRHATAGAAPFDYSLSYRAADQHPLETPAAQYVRPTVVEEDLSGDWRLYEIVLEPGQADGFYMHRSDWGFKWHQDTGLPYNVGQSLFPFRIEVTAFKAA